MSYQFWRRRVGGRLFLRVAGGVGLVCLLATLAACGAVGASTHSPTATATHSPVNPGGLMVRPCPGPSIATITNPTIIITGQTSHTPITAHVGDTIQIRLPAHAQRWTETGTPGAALTPLGTQGAYVTGITACVWAFQAAHAGTTMLHFSGQALCEGPNRPCPNYVIGVNLTIAVS